MSKKKYSVVDLFCGAGGLTLGFHLTNRFRSIGAMDCWQPAIDTFKYNIANIGKDRVICDDIEKYSNEKAMAQLESLWQFNGNGPDVITGGPPCQGMSLAGRRLNNDPRNQLFKSFVNFVKRLKPKVFIMENVPGLISAENGQILLLYCAFKKSVTTISSFTRLTSSKEIQVPQLERLFFIGLLRTFCKNLIWPPTPRTDLG